MFFCKFLLISPLFLSSSVISQTVVNLQVTGPKTQEQTYRLIRQALGPNSIQVPDCSHSPQVAHITQSSEDEDQPGKSGNSQRYFFTFTLHDDPDDDQCKNPNKQRAEISVSAEGAPEGALTTGANQKKRYTWAFRVSSDFRSPNQWTDIHQILAKTKAGPAISVLRIMLKTTPDGHTLIQVRTPGEDIKCSGDFTPYLGQWMEVDQVVLMGSSGLSESDLAISMEPRSIPGMAFLSCQRNPTGLQWRDDDYVYARPKWGIKRRKFQGRTTVQIDYDYFRIDNVEPDLIKDYPKKLMVNEKFQSFY